METIAILLAMEMDIVFMEAVPAFLDLLELIAPFLFAQIIAVHREFASTILVYVMKDIMEEIV